MHLAAYLHMTVFNKVGIAWEIEPEAVPTNRLKLLTKWRVQV